jgi:hypothetical protein
MVEDTAASAPVFPQLACTDGFLPGFDHMLIYDQPLCHNSCVKRRLYNVAKLVPHGSFHSQISGSLGLSKKGMSIL